MYIIFLDVVVYSWVRLIHRKIDPFSLISRLQKRREKNEFTRHKSHETNEEKKKKMGKWRDEPMNTGGAAAAPYQRAANDECRICGGEKKRVSPFLFLRALDLFFPAKIFFSFSLPLGADHFLSLPLPLFVAFVRRHWSLVRGVKRAWKSALL